MFSVIGHRILSWLEKQELRYLCSKMTVGERLDIKKGLRVTKPENITLGKYVSIGPNLTIQAHAPISIGDYTLIAADVTIVTAGHPIEKREMEMRTALAKPVKIGKSCWLGVGVMVLPGVTIGDGVIVGAGSVVTKDLPANHICFGVPAKPFKARPCS